MDEKERLTNLIQNAIGGCASDWAEDVAENLLENGVIALPCPLGSTVYIIAKYSCKECVKNLGGCDYKEQCPEKIYEREFTFSMRNSVGESVYLTPEEAEKVLLDRRRINDA